MKFIVLKIILGGTRTVRCELPYRQRRHWNIDKNQLPFYINEFWLRCLAYFCEDYLINEGLKGENKDKDLFSSHPIFSPKFHGLSAIWLFKSRDWNHPKSGGIKCRKRFNYSRGNNFHLVGRNEYKHRTENIYSRGFISGVNNDVRMIWWSPTLCLK